MESNQMVKAVEMLKRAMSIEQGWRPDSEEMEEFVGLVKNLELLTKDIYHKLLRTHIAGKPVSEILDRMKMDSFIPDEETHKILHSAISETQPLEQSRTKLVSEFSFFILLSSNLQMMEHSWHGLLRE